MKQYSIIWILAIFTLFQGCAKEDIDGAGDGTVFTLSLVSDSEEATRAPGEDQYNENLIEKVNVFFFDAVQQNIIYSPSPSQISYSANKITMSIPVGEENKLNNKSIILYAVANCNLPYSEFADKTYSQVKELVYESRSTLNPEPFVAQPSFLMDGVTTIARLVLSQTNLGTIVMKRAAAKVIVNIVNAEVDGYTIMEADAQINNYLDKTTLSEAGPLDNLSADDYKHSSFRPTYLSEPFYSYANDGRNEPRRESYITIRATWYNDSAGSIADYYYRIPFPKDGASSGLKRNTIYTFNVELNALGGTDLEEMVELEANLQLKDWTTYEIIAELDQFNYLVVAEYDISMHDVSQQLIHYAASAPVSIRIDEAYYYKYLFNGTISKVTLTPANRGFYPSITADAATNNIVIYCDIPVNYVSTHIVFTVINGALEQEVRVVQYPKQYLTSSYSRLEDIDFSDYSSDYWWNGGKGYTTFEPYMVNFNFYTVTTTNLSNLDNFVLGGNILELTDNMYTTKKDEESNRIVSPKFVIATHRGITQAKTYKEARKRCWLYSEGPYPKGTWRMPTAAEMQLVYKLQSDGNSALKDLFVIPPSGPGTQYEYWWVARYDPVSNEVFRINMKNGAVESTITGTNSVRCVHDVWKDQ